jgi:hypothetical protein
MLPFACMALAWVVDHPRRWLRVAFAVTLVYGVAISFLFVALGVRIYHTYLPFPLTDLYWPLISSGGIVPARNGETPQSLLTLIHGFPSGIAFWFLPLVLSVWATFAVRALVSRRQHRRPRLTATAPSSDAEAGARETAPALDMVAASR